jgi:hypothetical protein
VNYPTNALRQAFGRRPRRVEAFVASLVAVLVVACAGDPAGTLFRTTVVGPDGSYAQEVVLGDRTGLVEAIEPAELIGVDEPEVVNDEDDANALIFRWSNGACDRPAISFTRSGERFDLRVAFRQKFGSCMAILLFRAIRIRLTEPIAPNRIDVCCPR